MKKIFIVILIILFWGCKDNNYKPFLRYSYPHELQEFQITNMGDTIVGKKGTVIIIDSNTFNIDTTKFNNNIVLKLNEYYSLRDLILNNLTTVSNEKLLETNGMINLKFYFNNSLIVPEKDYKILFPKNYRNEQMFLFKGEENKVDKTINWVLLGSDQRMTERKTIMNDSVYAISSIQDSLFHVYSTLITGWFNCDMYWEDYETCKNFTISSSSTPIIFIIFKDVKAVTTATYFNGKYINCTMLPVGKKIDLLAIEEKNNKIYYWTNFNITIKESNHFKVGKMKEVTIDDLKKIIDERDWNK